MARVLGLSSFALCVCVYGEADGIEGKANASSIMTIIVFVHGQLYATELLSQQSSVCWHRTNCHLLHNAYSHAGLVTPLIRCAVGL